MCQAKVIFYPSTTLDSNSYWWMSVVTWTASYPYVVVYKCLYIPSTCLSTSADWTYSWNSGSLGGNYNSEIISLGSSKLSLLYWVGSSLDFTFDVQYTGSSWGSAYPTANKYSQFSDFSTFGSTTIGCAFYASTGLYYMSIAAGGTSWTETLIDSTVTSVSYGCGIASDGSADIVIIYQAGSGGAGADKVEDAYSTNSGSSWTVTQVLSSSESTPNYFGTDPSLVSSALLSSWTNAGGSTPWNIRVGSVNLKVTEKVTITPANSYSSGDTATVSGTAGCTPGTVAMDNTAHSLTCSPNLGATLTVTISGTAGYSFASNSTTVSWTTTGSGSESKSFTVYRMYYDTLEVTAKAAAVFDTGLTWSFTCAHSDTSSGTCALPHVGTSGATATVSYKYWTNYNQGITAPATASGAASGIQWENAAGTTSTAGTPTSGGNTYNTNYYKQGSMSISYSNSGGVGPCTAPTFYYTSLNAAQTYTMSGVPTAKWIDWGTTPTSDEPQPGSTSTEACNASTTSYSVSASGTIAPVYYLQYMFELSASSVPGASLPANPHITSTMFGSPYDVPLIGLGTNFWLDSGASWSVTNPVNSGNQRWDTSQTVSGTISSSSPTTAGNWLNWVYYEQEYSTFCAEPVNPSTFDAVLSIVVSGEQFGSGVTLGTITTSNGGTAACISAWSDHGYAATVTSTVADGSNKRIAPSTTTTGAINSSGQTFIFPYFLQIQLTFNLFPLAPSTFDNSRTIKVTGPVLGLKTILWTYTSTNGDGKQSQAIWFDDSNFLDCESSTGGTSGTSWVSNMTETGVLSTPGGVLGVTCGYTLLTNHFTTTTSTTVSTSTTTSETTTLSTYSTTTTTTPGTTTSTTETQTSWSPTTETTTTTTSTSVSPSTTTSTTTQTSWSPTTETTTTSTSVSPSTTTSTTTQTSWSPTTETTTTSTSVSPSTTTSTTTQTSWSPTTETTTTTTSTSLTSTDTQTTSTTTIESTSTETSVYTTVYTTTSTGPTTTQTSTVTTQTTATVTTLNTITKTTTKTTTHGAGGPDCGITGYPPCTTTTNSTTTTRNFWNFDPLPYVVLGAAAMLLVITFVVYGDRRMVLQLHPKITGPQMPRSGRTPEARAPTLRGFQRLRRLRRVRIPGVRRVKKPKTPKAKR